MSGASPAAAFLPYPWPQDARIAIAYTLIICPVIAVLLIREIRRRATFRPARTGGHPQCATCGYIIHPGSSPICPECGSDVTERGLVAGAASAPVALGPWYALALLAAIPAAAWLQNWLNTRQPFGWAYSVQRCVWVGPTRGRNAPHFTVWGSGDGRFFGRRATAINIMEPHPPPDLDPRNDHLSTLNIDLESGQATMNEDDEILREIEEGPFTPEMLRRYVSKFAPDLPPAAQQRIAAELEQQMQAIIAGHFPRNPMESFEERQSVDYMRKSWGGNFDATCVTLALVCYAAISAAACLPIRRRWAVPRETSLRAWRGEAARLQLAPPT